MAIEQLLPPSSNETAASARAKLNAAIDKANLVDGKAAQAALDALSALVAGKADTTALAALTAGAPTDRNTFAEVATILASLQAALGDKQDASDTLNILGNAALGPNQLLTTGGSGAAAARDVSGYGIKFLNWLAEGDGEGKFPYVTAGNAMGAAVLTNAGRALLDDPSAEDQRVTLGLGNVDNTSDANKPVSTAQAFALNALATLIAALPGLGAFLLPRERPAEAPWMFTGSLAGGDPAALAALSSAPVDTLEGPAWRIAGAAVLAQRNLWAVEPGRLYEMRCGLKRAVDPSDPAQDAVRIGVAWYASTKAAIPGASGQSVITDINNLTVASGRRTVSATLSRGSGASVQAPSFARFGRLFVQTYGNVPATDVEVLAVRDVTVPA